MADSEQDANAQAALQLGNMQGPEPGLHIGPSHWHISYHDIGHVSRARRGRVISSSESSSVDSQAPEPHFADEPASAAVHRNRDAAYRD
jgi:hypothetical protein